MLEDEFQCIVIHAAVMTEKFSAHICMHSCPDCNNTANNVRVHVRYETGDSLV